MVLLLLLLGPPTIPRDSHTWVNRHIKERLVTSQTINKHACERARGRERDAESKERSEDRRTEGREGGREGDLDPHDLCTRCAHLLQPFLQFVVVALKFLFRVLVLSHNLALVGLRFFGLWGQA